MAVEQPQCCGVVKLACMAYFYVFSVMLQLSSLFPMDWCKTQIKILTDLSGHLLKSALVLAQEHTNI